MKKLILLFLFIPLGLFSQYYDTVPNKDRIQILDLYDLKGMWNYSDILPESYRYKESRENFKHNSEYIDGGKIEKSFDIKGTLREELFQAATYNVRDQSYLRLFNQWGKLK